MPYIQVGTENSGKINLYYEDHGKGKPVVLIHGFPQSSTAWEKQVPVLLNAGYRTIAYDRRGFGKSDQPTDGYAYDTFAADLDKLMTQLDLHDAILVGHSMGTGEVIRYIAKYGSARVEKVVCLAPTAPFLLKTGDNPEGLEQTVFDGFQKAIREDRFAYLTQFFSDFYHAGLLAPKRVSSDAIQSHWNVGAQASAIATYACVPTWATDFRQDLRKLNIPTLIVQGTADKILPIKITGQLMHEQVPQSQFVPIDGAPHGLSWTHYEDINRELLQFMSNSAARRSVA